MILGKARCCLLILAICVQICLVIQSKHEDNFKAVNVRFRSIKCQGDNKTISVKYCNLKAVSRKVVFLNVGIIFLVPFVYPYYTRGIVYYRYGTIEREAIDTKMIELCGFLGGGDKNLLVKLFIDMIGSRLPNLVHKCPYIGDFDLKNYTLNLDLVDRATMMFSQGIYRYDLFCFYNGSVALNVSTSIEIKSPLKESFG